MRRHCGSCSTGRHARSEDWCGETGAVEDGRAHRAGGLLPSQASSLTSLSPLLAQGAEPVAGWNVAERRIEATEVASLERERCQSVRHAFLPDRSASVTGQTLSHPSPSQSKRVTPSRKCGGVGLTLHTCDDVREQSAESSTEPAAHGRHEGAWTGESQSLTMHSILLSLRSSSTCCWISNRYSVCSGLNLMHVGQKTPS